MTQLKMLINNQRRLKKEIKMNRIKKQVKTQAKQKKRMIALRRSNLFLPGTSIPP